MRRRLTLIVGIRGFYAQTPEIFEAIRLRLRATNPGR